MTGEEAGRGCLSPRGWRPPTWVVDNGSSHAGRAGIDQLEGSHETLRLVHCPIHASRLSQIELFFSIVQRKALTPHDFDSLEALAERLLRIGEHPPADRPTLRVNPHRADLDRLLGRVELTHAIA